MFPVFLLGVPDVLATLFDGSGNGEHESMSGASSSQPSCGGLCGTLKTLLMSSSYPVRSATARLISSLCSEGPSSAEVTGNANRAGCFFREALVAARTTGKLPVQYVTGISTQQEQGCEDVAHIFFLRGMKEEDFVRVCVSLHVLPLRHVSMKVHAATLYTLPDIY